MPVTPSSHDLPRSPAVDRHDGHATGHGLEQDDPEGLRIGGVDEHVHAVNVRPRVGHLARHRDVLAHLQLADQPRQGARVLRRQRPRVAADEQHVHRVTALAQQRRGAHQAVLSLPRLQPRDQADHERPRGQLGKARRRAGRGLLGRVLVGTARGSPRSRPPPRTSAWRGGSAAVPRPPRARCSRSPQPAGRWRHGRASGRWGSRAATTPPARASPPAPPRARRTAGSWPSS